MTRRDVIGIGLALPGFASLQLRAASSKEFWNNKPSSDWTKDEIQDLLNRSPWAKEVNVSDKAPGMDLGRGAGEGGHGGGYVGGGGIVRFAPQGGPGRFTAMVRWDSALPIREAMRAKPSKDAGQYYIIAVGGNLPDMGQIVSADGQTQDQQRMEALKQYTWLERKSAAIPLSRMTATPPGYPSGGANLFYFERRDPILADDKQVTFVTRVGPFEVKARFNLKEMLYRGKLEI